VNREPKDDDLVDDEGVSIEELTRLFGVSNTTILKMKAAGAFQDHPKRPTRMTRASVEAFRATLQASRVMPKPESDEPNKRETTAEILSVLSQGLKLTHGHLESIFKILNEREVESNKRLEISLTHITSELASARHEIGELRIRDREMVAQREELDSKRHERELESLKQMRHEERLDGLAKDVAPYVGEIGRSLFARLSDRLRPAVATPASAETSSTSSTTAPVATSVTPDLGDVPNLSPSVLRAVCSALSAEQVELVIHTLAPRFDDIDRELSQKRAAASTDPPSQAPAPNETSPS
jgi:hypothetical protein